MKEFNSNLAHSPLVSTDIKNDIELKIIAGRFAVGEQMPSIRRIAEAYNVGLSTAQKVLRELLTEGVIEAEHGKGFYVKPFIREKLAASRKKIMEKHMADIIHEADIIGFDLVAMIEHYRRTHNETEEREELL